MVEDNKLVVEKRRRYTDAAELLRDKLAADGGRKLGVASLVARAFTEDLKILVNEEIIGFYNSNINFAQFLTGYFIGRPRWLL
jgi:hypothetical protein